MTKRKPARALVGRGSATTQSAQRTAQSAQRAAFVAIMQHIATIMAAHIATVYGGTVMPKPAR